MIQQIQKFDLWIIEGIFEKFTHWIQQRLGWSNFFLSKICCVVFPFFELWRLGVRPSIFFPLIAGCIFYIATAMVEWLADHEHLTRQKNSLKAFNLCIFARLVLLVMVPVGLLEAHTSSVVVAAFLTLVMYLLSCDPLPPQRKIFPSLIQQSSGWQFSC